ncbi:MAG: phospholipid carrier-dependent glycosyltransferase [Candidatus Omnitrophota bacterium]
MKNIIAVIILLCIFVVLVISSMRENSGTCDEIAHHIPAGVIMLTKGDLKMDTSQPPLARYIIALPVVLFLNPVVPTEKEIWRVEDRSIFGRDFFFKDNIHPKRILFASRLMIVMIGCLCGLIIFLWSKSLFGIKTAVFALFFYIFSPDIITHAQLATTDMAATFFVLLSIYCFWRFSKNKNNLNLLITGITLGLAQLAKYSAMILYPIFIFLMVIEFILAKRIIWKSCNSLILIFLLSIVTIWAGYGFSLKPILKDAMRVEEKLQVVDSQTTRLLPFLNTNSRSKVNNFLLRIPVPLGEHLLGISGIAKHGKDGHRSYFLGRWSSGGNLLYFVVAFFIKTPISLLLLLIWGIFTLHKDTSLLNRYFLAVPPLIYFIVASFSNLQIGVRHLLPMYPFCFILAASSVYLLEGKIFKAIFVILCMWYVAGSLFIWPHYLSYFNELAGGPDNGWKYLRDSNIDWGQDLPALGKYIKRNNIGEVRLMYFGEDSPGLYGINFKKINNKEVIKPENKVYAISVQYLDSINWAINLKPTTKAGYSIFIYDFRDRTNVQK